MSHFFLADEKWTLNITIGDVKRVKTMVGVDLMQPLPVTRPLSNEFKEWLSAGGFMLGELKPKQEIFLRNIYSEKDPAEASLLAQLQSDPILLIDVIFVLVKPQADARSLTDEQFGIKVGGEELNSIVDAFWGAYEDFFQKCGNSALEKLIHLNRKMMAKAMDSAEKSVDLEKIEAPMDQQLQEMLDEAEGELDGNG